MSCNLFLFFDIFVFLNYHFISVLKWTYRKNFYVKQI